MAPASTFAVANPINEAQLAAELASRLPGTSANASQLVNVSPTTIVWVERGDEVVVHLDSVQVRLLPGSLLVSVDMETDQTGRATLVAAFALGGTGDPAGLTAVTDDLPKGLGTLTARWGKILQAAIWASLLSFALDSAAQQGGAPIGLAVSQGSLTVIAGTSLSVQAKRP